MGSEHECKIIFNEKTKVILEEDTAIPKNVFNFKNTAEILSTGGDSDYLIDIIGLVTSVSREKKYTKADHVTRMIELEITDDKGKINCALFGNYVDIVKQYVATDGSHMPVVVVQFAKIKTFKGSVVIQNVMNASLILWNPPIAEAVSFRNGLALHGIEADMPLAMLIDDDDDDEDVHVITLEEEFLTLYPRKGIKDLNETEENGVFIVLAQIGGLLDGEKWWYSACGCHRAVTTEDGMIYCGGCRRTVLSVTPRFRLKLEVDDGGDSAIFVMFDTDSQQLLGKTCKELVVTSKGKYSHEYPHEIRSIVGTELLFKVEKSPDHGTKFDESFKIKKICADRAVIEAFKDESKIQTPHKMIKRGGSHVFNGSTVESVGDDSTNMSEIGTNALSLDQISPGDVSAVCSSVQSIGSDGSTSTPAKRMKLRSVKIEKE
ncbi:uncharacterized protein LOC130721389 isoform X2 [Lotus japonicus]|nr:uncharacterized protein LOC130721389 isoform X2 [Lotus japonicus]